MIRPIVAYGATVLKKKSENISEEYPNLSKLIEDMWETMYASKGVGLAAPQIGLSIRIFVIDTKPFASDDELDSAEAKTLEFFKKVFVNPQIIKEEGDSWSFNEGCLSIPEVREDINRKEKITIQYRDEKFKLHTEILDGLAARVVQHEYDHIEGILFTDHLSSLKKRLIKNKLTSISKGLITVDYPMKFPNKLRRK
tara:strand:- start:372 stop:962 length:591 start_codon:yes stop_codon:yes gene_type:complete